jgi:hypothetical protein
VVERRTELLHNGMGHRVWAHRLALQI